MDIPRRLVQTGHMSANTSKTSEAWRELNPGYAYHYYNDAECAAFLEERFNADVVRAFHSLRPGAFKADLFRYAYLYVRGGVYMDMDMAPQPPHTLEDILAHSPHAQLVACIERPGIRGVWQGFIACVPRLPCFRAAVDKIVQHTRAKYYPSAEQFRTSEWEAILAITGPVLLAQAMPGLALVPGAQRMGDTEVYLHVFDDDVRHPDSWDILISGTGADYEQNPMQRDYGHLVLKREVYA